MGDTPTVIFEHESHFLEFSTLEVFTDQSSNRHKQPLHFLVPSYFISHSRIMLYDGYLFYVFLHPLEFNLLDGRNWVFLFKKKKKTTPYTLSTYVPGTQKMLSNFLNE